jgi:hypothetical protein
MMMNWKGFGRKWSWPNFKVLSRYSTGGTEENHETLNQDTRSPGTRYAVVKSIKLPLILF